MASIPYLTDTRFDHGALSHLPAVLKGLGAARPMIVTDPGVVAAGLLGKVLEALGSEPAAVFDATPGNPTEAAVLAALAVWRDSGADSLVALGGGSAMDLAKAAGILTRAEGPLARFGAAQRGSRHIPKLPPLVAVPTTSGTGSEVSIGAVIVLESGLKELFVSKHLIPAVALCDPDLTLGLPAGLTAATGMDAVVHCVESILSPVVNPPADAIAADGIARAVRDGMLVRAVRDGSDREARWHMMMASTEGALAFVKGLGSVHALSHAAGRLKQPSLHHGTLNAIFLPHVMRVTLGARPEADARIAQAMGLAPGADLAAAFARLNAELGIAPNLAVLGLGPEHEAGIVENALADVAHLTNARPLDAAAYRDIYRAALAGAA